MDESELMRIAESVSHYENENIMNSKDNTKKNDKKASKIVLEALSGFPLGKNAGRPYICKDKQAIEIGSMQYRDFIAYYSYTTLNLSLTDSQINEIWRRL